MEETYGGRGHSVCQMIILFERLAEWWHRENGEGDGEW